MSYEVKIKTKRFPTNYDEINESIAIRLIDSVLNYLTCQIGSKSKYENNHCHKNSCDKSRWPDVSRELDEKIDALGIRHLIKKIEFDPTIVTEATPHTPRIEGMIMVYGADVIKEEVLK